MDKYLGTRRKRLVRVLLCFLFTAICAGAANANHADAEKNNPPSQSISDLMHNVFRITTENRKRTMTLITGYSGEPWTQQWWNEGYGKPCTQNVAMLNRAERSTTIKINGADTILAFLDCPAANDGGAASIVAFFRPTKTTSPICFNHIQLMNKPKAFFYGSIQSLDVRRLSDASHVVVAALTGGDAGDSWISYAFVHVDDKCSSTLLARFYAHMHLDTDDASKCAGEKAAYRFVNDTTVEIRRERIFCGKSGMRTQTKSARKLDLRVLLGSPALRPIEP
jgi:hypothetical protein